MFTKNIEGVLTFDKNSDVRRVWLKSRHRRDTAERLSVIVSLEGQPLSPSLRLVDHQSQTSRTVKCRRVEERKLAGYVALAEVDVHLRRRVTPDARTTEISGDVLDHGHVTQSSVVQSTSGRVLRDEVNVLDWSFRNIPICYYYCTSYLL